MAEIAFDRELVRHTLKERRITHAALAEAVGLTHRSAVPKILSGERRVEVGEAAKIYEFLKLIPIEHVGVHVVPVIGLASAGNWREAIEMPIGRMMVPSHVASSRSFAVEVKGDSLDGLGVVEGDWIVIDPDDKVLSPGKVYLLQSREHEVTVKRYQKLPPRFEPVSSNPDNLGFLVSEHDFSVLGRVVWKGGRVE